MFRRAGAVFVAVPMRQGTVAAQRLTPPRLQYTQRRRMSATPVRRGPSKLVIGTVALTLIGGGAYYGRLKKNSSVDPEEFNRQQQELFASLSADELRRTGVTLYRYLTCPFCGKVQAFLERFNIPYTTVEVDPLFKSQLGDVGGYSKVPVVRLGLNSSEGPMLVDSYEIVSALAPKLGGGQDTEDVLKWRKWAGEEFVRYLTLNLNRNLTDAYNSSCYIDVADNIPWVNKMASKVIGSVTMYLVVQVFITRKKLMKLGWDGKDERAALYGQMDKWVTEGLNGRSFHGGDGPDSADTDVYGVLNAIRGLPAYMDVMRNANSEVRTWVARMDKRLGREPVQLE